MRKMLVLTLIVLAVAGAAAGTTMMLRARNAPPPPPPDPRVCLTAAHADGMSRENLTTLARLGRTGNTALDRIKLREELRTRRLPPCEWALNELDQRE